jgi:plastocyanin
MNPPPIPPLTSELQETLRKSNGFQALVSYTDRGFEPALRTISAGETIRFTNNSNTVLWIAARGDSGALYPGTGNNCGQSAFDSCRVLAPGEFWEFTFDSVGTWTYQNSANEHTGSIVVNDA